MQITSVGFWPGVSALTLNSQTDIRAAVTGMLTWGHQPAVPKMLPSSFEAWKIKRPDLGPAPTQHIHSSVSSDQPLVRNKLWPNKSHCILFATSSALIALFPATVSPEEDSLTRVGSPTAYPHIDIYNHHMNWGLGGVKTLRTSHIVLFCKEVIGKEKLGY